MSLWHKSTVNKRRWKPVRLDILDLANWRCRSCGGYANEVDHRIPVHLGGEPYQRDNLQAHAHYRSGETKDAITDANNAFESTLKAICDQRQWPYDRGARASDLLKVVRTHGLLPDYLDASFDQLVATLKSGLPKVRNQGGVHGQGAIPRETPDYVAAYALHLAAAKILFLVEAHKAMK